MFTRLVTDPRGRGHWDVRVRTCVRMCVRAFHSPSGATRRCKHPTESRLSAQSFQSRMFTASPGVARLWVASLWERKKTTRRGRRRCPLPSYLSLGRLQVVSRHDVDEEVELVELGDGHGDVVPLEGNGQGKVKIKVKVKGKVSEVLAFMAGSNGGKRLASMPVGRVVMSEKSSYLALCLLHAAEN